MPVDSVPLGQATRHAPSKRYSLSLQTAQASGSLLLQRKQPLALSVHPLAVVRVDEALVDVDVEELVDVEDEELVVVEVEVEVDVDVDVLLDDDVEVDELVDVVAVDEPPPLLGTVAVLLTHSRPRTPVPLASVLSGHSLTQRPSDR